MLVHIRFVSSMLTGLGSEINDSYSHLADFSDYVLIHCYTNRVLPLGEQVLESARAHPH